MPVVSPGWDWTKHMFVIAHMECDFIPKLTLKTVNPIVKTRAVSISNKSFELEYIITSTATDGSEIVPGKGKRTLSKKTTKIPDWLRKDLTEYEPDLNS